MFDSSYLAVHEPKVKVFCSVLTKYYLLVFAEFDVELN